MRLKDIAIIKTNFEDADFWITRRGDIKKVGSPSKIFNPEHIGIKIERKDILLPNYLFYCFEDLHTCGEFKKLAVGTLALVHIKSTDIANIELVQR